MRLFSTLILCFLAAACASVEYVVPRLARTDIAGFERAALQDAMDTSLARRRMVYDLAWPIYTANTELCPKTTKSIGVVLAGRKLHGLMAGGLREQDMEALGVPDALHILHVYRNSPAAQAGVAQGDIVQAVNGDAVSTPSKAGKAIRDAAQVHDVVTITLSTDGIDREVTITPIERCDMALKIAQSDSINATASTGEIVIYQGLIRVLSPEALQFVIAHEAAHLAGRHPQKYVRNITVSGAVVAGPVIYTGAWLGDKVVAITGQKPERSLRQKSLRMLAPWAEVFEAEADYLGAYFYARAGGDVRSAREVFAVFARENPNSIYLRVTHPLVPERMMQLAATADEIDAKKEHDEALIPNRVDP